MTETCPDGYTAGKSIWMEKRIAMKLLRIGASGIFALCLIIVLLITAVEAVVYWTPGYFSYEYEKHQVQEDVQMEMDELMTVTEHMMGYLRGEEEVLQISAVVDGRERNFFSQRELDHMEDVKGLFLGGLRLRRICMIASLGCMLLLRMTGCRLRAALPRAVCIGSGIFVGVTAVLGLLIATDFTRYFTVFHHIFFDNDLWILDPDVDLLINIVPEPFFIDTAIYIGIVFCGAMAAILGLCLWILRKQAEKGQKKKTLDHVVKVS